ncbi:MAG: acyl-CoA dehydrogenase family protein [Kiritimatiellia bacterium]|jgi:alkylation response protein AidB-like acyl-CoA dehydrogenase
MANFFNDNEDIRFLFGHYDFRRIAALMEEDFRYNSEFDFAPADAADAVDNYRRLLELIGGLAGERIAPTAEHTDTVGNVLNSDGSVTYAPGIAEAIRLLGQADLMGFTLPYRYGGLNAPQLLYAMSNDIVSRADASLMNLYGLQGIAETINAFASDDIKEAYLPRLASGELTGAMVLTEPDAGSDLQAVKTRAYQNEAGEWFVHGVKRFITNGCGDVLLVLARTEPHISDGRGLSCLLVEKGPKVKVRRLEHKLGINGSPTCELFFDHAPARLIGQRQRGLITYVMSLMNGARLGIAAQSLGIGEAACREARNYALSRRQFGVAIDELPAVRDLLVDMSVDLQAARALTYYSAFCVDLERGLERRLEAGLDSDPEAVKQLRTEIRKYKSANKLLTPLAKYYSSEMSMRVANSAMAVLGGSGYMKDYPVERILRDSRITTIYEGTSQLQVVAAIGGVMSGALAGIVDEVLGAREWPAAVAPLVEQVRAGLKALETAVAYVKEHPEGIAYRDLYARKLVDMAVDLLIAALFCDQAAASERKLLVARRWLGECLPRGRALQERICSGETLTFTDFEALAVQPATAD